MSGKTGIEWTDSTWNAVVGCKRVSPGCDHCYAFQLHDQRHIAWKRGHWPDAPKQYHQPFSRVQLLPDRLSDPLHWRKPRRVFVNSMSDLFHEDVPDEYIERVFAVMAVTPQHTYQVLTKRPERMQAFVASIAATPWGPRARMREAVVGLAHTARERLRLANLIDYQWRWPLPNVWVGGSAEDQERARQRLPYVLDTPAAVHFVSVEPQLGPITLLEWWRDHKDCWETWLDGLQWVIIGGESGSHARPFDPAWALRLVRECQAKDVPVFCKQLGSVWAKANDAKDRHGGDPADWPQELRVRQWPDAARKAVLA